MAFISPITYQRTEDIVPFLFEQGKNPLVILLDGLTDVRNFGAIARTCECAGVDAIIIPSKNSVSVNADAIKTSAGALHTIPVCREQNLTNTIKFLKDSGFKIVAATEKAIMTIRKPITKILHASSWEQKIPAYLTNISPFAMNGLRFHSWGKLNLSMFPLLPAF